MLTFREKNNNVSGEDSSSLGRPTDNMQHVIQTIPELTVPLGEGTHASNSGTLSAFY